MIYLASPYTHDNPDIREQRFRDVSAHASMMMNMGFHVISPICHSHPIAIAGGLPTTWEYWEEFDRRLLSICDHLCVLMLDGWDVSIGVTAEVKMARELEIPVTHEQPGCRGESRCRQSLQPVEATTNT